MATLILWGQHPLYAGGYWIKLCENPSDDEIAFRKLQGMELVLLPPGKHPDE